MAIGNVMRFPLLARDVLLGKRPDGKAGCNLVVETSKVVHQIGESFVTLPPANLL